jgi:hypothetical protein
MHVYAIEDEKYGLQVICKTKEIANREYKKEHNHPSGYSCIISKIEVIDK